MDDNVLNDLGYALTGFVVGTEGNISRRITNGFLIKNSGKSLIDNSFIHCDMDGKPFLDTEKPSMEVSFHALIYKNSNYNFIAHTHPVNTLKILCSDRAEDFALERLFPDQVVFNGTGSCLVPYATPGEELTSAISYAVRSYDSFPPLLLLKNHGIICCGDTAEQVVTMTEICEKAAEIFIGSRLLGRSSFLSYNQIRAIKNHKDEIYRKTVQYHGHLR